MNPRLGEVRAWIGLGSNLDDPRHQVETAFAELDRVPATRLLRRSRLYRSEPWGVREQPEFINAVAELATSLAPDDLLAHLLAIERAHGRERSGLRNGPRVLDLDLLLYGDRRVEQAGLDVPHPRLRDRAFVLMPLAELAPALDVPGQGRVADLLAEADASGCRPAEA